MTIGELARQVGVNVETIRYYQRLGLLDTPLRPESGFRQYGEAHQERLLFIVRAKELGFALKEVRELLDCREYPDSCAQTCAATERLLAKVRRRIRSLTVLEQTLEGLLDGCSQNSGCLILETLSGGQRRVSSHRGRTATDSSGNS